MKNRERHLAALCDISEVFALLAGSSDIKAFLGRAVSMVAAHLDASVSSVYLYDEASKDLVLRATIGLSGESVDNVRMSKSEGLVGLAFRELRPVWEADASQSPHFKYFPQSNEDPYGSFAAVPILRGAEKIGVLAAQRPTGVVFKEDEILLLQALTSQLAVAIENARVLLSIEDVGNDGIVEASKPLPSIMNGSAAAPGCAFGKTVFKERSSLIEGSLEDEVSSPEEERRLLERAIAATITQLDSLHEVLEERIPEVASLIFSAHLMMLKDSGFTKKMYALIDANTGASSAVIKVAGSYIDLFDRSVHDYMKEKSADVKDLALRILSNLNGCSSSSDSVNKGKIVVAEELLPSEILRLAIEGVGGVLLLHGGITSHVAILARSLEIPMVIAEHDVEIQIPEGVTVLLDANIGNVFFDPGDEVIDQFRSQLDGSVDSEMSMPKVLKKTHTSDGVRVSLLANINLLSELDTALALNAEGVGLYRTEFPYLVRQSLPTEEEQFRVYAKLIQKMAGRPVTVRTLDVGGDKTLTYFDHASERNPELGLRSLRFSLQHEDLFRVQLTALLRAARQSDLGIMFPMVGSLDEFRAARALLKDCMRTLDPGEMPRKLRVGVMVELPSIVQVIDEMAKEADFLSIGTNDFVQYMLAADRTNSAVSDYYNPWEPGVLRPLAKVVRSAVSAEKPLSVCGEMAQDPAFIPFLIGIGVRSLSVDPRRIYDVQRVIRSLNIETCETNALDILRCSSASEVAEYLST